MKLHLQYSITSEVFKIDLPMANRLLADYMRIKKQILQMVMVLCFHIALHQSYSPFRALYIQIHTGATQWLSMTHTY